MRILLTGSGGFIGQSLGKFLEEIGAEVIPYDTRDDVQNSVLDFSRLSSSMRGLDGVVHLAAMSQPKATYENPRDCVNINIGGTANVLAAVRENKKENYPWVVFLSSREVFGEPAALPITEKTPLNPKTLYGLTKVAGESLCRIFSENYGLKTRIIRLTSVYSGKNDRLDRVIPKFIIQAAKNKPLLLHGTGEETFDFTYIQDVVRGIGAVVKEVAQSQKLHDDFILSCGQPVFLKDLAKIIIEETGSQSEIKYEIVPRFSTTKCYADCRKAKEILGFNPKIAIREGIKLVIQEFREAKII